MFTTKFQRYTNSRPSKLKARIYYPIKNSHFVIDVNEIAPNSLFYKVTCT